MNKSIKVVRQPIIQRTPIQIANIGAITCNSCEKCNTSQSQDMVTIHVNKDQNWAVVKEQVQHLAEAGKTLRIITDCKLPKRVLWASSYSDKNILQINLNMLELDASIGWVEQEMIIANRCGMYCVLCLYPIIPEVVKVESVLGVIDRFKAYGHFHVFLSFYKGDEEYSEYLDLVEVNGNLMDSKWVTPNDKGLECSTLFEQLYMNYITAFTEPRKLKASVCSSECNCTVL